MIDWKTINGEGFLAPTMAKDFPNLPVVKSEGLFYIGVDGKNILILHQELLREYRT